MWVVALRVELHFIQSSSLEIVLEALKVSCDRTHLSSTEDSILVMQSSRLRHEDDDGVAS